MVVSVLSLRLSLPVNLYMTLSRSAGRLKQVQTVCFCATETDTIEKITHFFLHFFVLQSTYRLSYSTFIFVQAEPIREEAFVLATKTTEKRNAF